ncbi:hypothetical protein BCD22_003858 [Escherichia coli]|nr:hypothetical protein [Escherichia coli]
MKKTLISLAVAAGAVMSVSSVANAYTPSFSNGDISLGGTISTPVQAALYEGKVGSLSGLDATIPVGASTVTIAAPANAGLLALRSVAGFNNTASDRIANITFNGVSLLDAASGDSFSNGAIQMTLDVQDDTGSAIGDVVFPMQVAAVITTEINGDVWGTSMFASADTHAFYGGLPTSASQAVTLYSDAVNVMNGLFSDVTANLPQITRESAKAEVKNFALADAVFNTAYAAGIVMGENITINLDNPATTGSVAWTASMPIVVTYK